jgi:hypothetical protein
MLQFAERARFEPAARLSVSLHSASADRAFGAETHFTVPYFTRILGKGGGARGGLSNTPAFVARDSSTGSAAGA